VGVWERPHWKARSPKQSGYSEGGHCSRREESPCVKVSTLTFIASRLDKLFVSVLGMMGVTRSLVNRAQHDSRNRIGNCRVFTLTNQSGSHFSIYILATECCSPDRCHFSCPVLTCFLRRPEDRARARATRTHCRAPIPIGDCLTRLNFVGSRGASSPPSVACTARTN
jgi:hypothetical protein